MNMGIDRDMDFLRRARPAGLRRAGRLAGVCLALMMVGGPGCHREGAAPGAAGDSAPPSSVVLGPRDVATVSAERVRSGIRVVGTLTPWQVVEVKARMSEEVESLMTDRGMVVTQGQVLARLDDRGPQSELNRIRSQLAAAERDYRASEILFRGGAISERAHMNARVAVDGAEAQRVEAEQAVAHAVVRAPMDGVISDRAVSLGEAVSPGQRLFTVVNSDQLECVVSVLPSDAIHLRREQPALLRVAAYGGMELEGSVHRIDPLADAQTRRVGVAIRIPNHDARVVAGLFCTGTILTNAAAAETSILLVPAAAVRVEDGDRVAYVVRDGRMHRTAVTLAPGEDADGRVEVRTGLAAGDTVVLSSTQVLRDGVAVTMPGEGSSR